MTQNIDRYFVLAGLVFAGAGLVLGNVMGESGDHSQMPTHAHIMLAGFVFSFIYGAAYRLWPALKSGWMPIAHFVLHILGAFLMITGLFFVYGGMASEESVLIFFITGPLGIILGWLFFIVWFFLKGKGPITA